MQNPGLDEVQAGIKTAGRDINNLIYAGNTSLMVESEEELKNLLHSENQDHGIWLHPFMANRWGINGNSNRLNFLDSKITADGDYSHDIKSSLLLGKKAMINLDSVLKSRDITLLTKVHRVKTMVFPVVIYRCESLTINTAECRELTLFNCDAKVDCCESLGQQGDQTN